MTKWIITGSAAALIAAYAVALAVVLAAADRQDKGVTNE